MIKDAISNATNTPNNTLLNFESVHKKQFTVNNTPLTHRQINTLSIDGLVPENRENTNEWRKFSFVELVYLHLIYHLKNFGIKHNVLKGFKIAYFGAFYKLIFDRFLIGEEILLVVTSDGQTSLYTPSSYMYGRPDIPFVHIQVNQTINEILSKLGNSTYPIRWGIKQRFLEGKDYKSISEKEVLDIIRSQRYIKVVVKKNGKTLVVEATNDVENMDKKSHEELLKIAVDRKFGDMTITTRDGEVVKCVLKDTYKIKS